MSKRKQRKVLTIQQKIDILDKIDSGSQQNSLAKEYGVTEGTISIIKAGKDELRRAWESGEVKSNTRSRKQPKYKEVDDALSLWFGERRAESTPLNQMLLSAQAKVFATELGVTGFKASNGFVEKFKKRKNITCKAITGESASVDDVVCDDWVKNTLPHLIENYQPDDIFNADESALYYRALPTKTLAYRDETCKGGKLCKERVTFLLFVNMTGTERLKPVVIGKSENPRCFAHKHISKSELGVDYYASKKAWMTSRLWTIILTRLDRKMKLQNRKILLFVDNCTAHVLEATAVLKNVTVTMLPKNTTSKLQPLDQGVINAVKIHYRTALVQRLIVHLMRKLPSAAFRIELTDTVVMLEYAFRSLKDSVIVNAFRKAGFNKTKEQVEQGEPDATVEIVEEFEATETTFRNVFETMQELMEQINERLPESDPLEYLAIDERVITKSTMSDREIIEFVTNDGSESEEELEVAAKPAPELTIMQVMDAIQVVKTYCVQRHVTCDVHIHATEQAILDARHRNAVQRKIDSYFSCAASEKQLTATADTVTVATDASTSIQAKQVAGNASGDSEGSVINDSTAVKLTCAVCKAPCGDAHHCKVCLKPVHAIDTCSTHADGEEGYGQPVVCLNCK